MIQVDLHGRVAIVTGGSRGIGRATAIQLAACGAKVAVNYNRHVEAAQAVLAHIQGLGGEAIAVQGDVADMKAVQSLVETVLSSFGRVDILVNNAGITRDTLLMRMSEEDWDVVLNTNLKGAFNCIKSVTKTMVKQRYGRIINVTSVSGVAGNAGQANYSAAKAGMIGLTKAAAKELASRNITVNAVAPGFIETDITADLSEELKKSILAMTPVGRWGKPEDVAYAVTFLASQEAGFITGHVLAVDGGLVM